MSLRRIAILFARELRASAGNFLMIFAVVVPLVFTLLINLIFGDLFAGKPSWDSTIPPVAASPKCSWRRVT
jgi:hypothetical protein